MRSKIKVTAPEQGDIEVTVYRSDGSTQAKAYTTETGTTLVTWALTVDAGETTTMWVPVGAYVVSVKTTDGVEFAGGYGSTRAVWVDNDGVDLRPEPPVGAYGGAAGPGTGDLLSTNNLSDVASAATARTNLGVDYTTLDERTRDVIGAALVAGTNVTITPNDGADTITIAASGGGGGSVATDAIFDAKGDLPVGTGADTAAKLTVGANDSVLMADSSTSTGLIWARPQFSPRLITGRYYSGSHGYDVGESAAFVADQLVVCPFYVPEKKSIDRLGVAVTTAVASSTMYLGLYLADDTGGLPGTLIVAGSGTLDTSTTGGKEYTVSASIGPGILWAVAQTGSTGGARTRSIAAGQRLALGRGALTDSNPAVSLTLSRTAAALPASLAGSSWTYSNNLPHGVQVRIA